MRRPLFLVAQQHGVKFLMDSQKFWALPPNLRPVNLGVCSRSTAQNFHKPLGWVAIRGAGLGAMPFEVLDHDSEARS